MTLSARNRDLIFLSAIAFLCFFWRLGSISLFDFNEGFYVEAAREMYLRGDYVTPQVNGAFFFDKPPLVLWLAAGSFHLFGVTEFAARLPVAIAAALMVFLTYFFASRYFGRKTGLFAGAIMGANPLVFFTARQMTMDIVQSLFFCAAMVGFFLGYTAKTARGKNWYYVLWVSCGLGYLAKSIPGLFPIAISFTFVLVSEKFELRSIWSRIREARVFGGLVLMFLILFPWHYLAYRANGEIFYQQYWVLHHLKLASGSDFNHVQPWYFYVPMLMAGLFPWSLFLPFVARFRRGVASGGETNESEKDVHSAYRFVAVWAIVVFFIFSVMRSKLISYLIPMYPAAAILIADWLVRTVEAPERRRTLSWGLFTVAASCVAMTVGCALYVLKAPVSLGAQSYDFSAAWIWVVEGLVLVVLGISGALILAFAGKRQHAVFVMTCGVASFFLIAVPRGTHSIEMYMNAPLHKLAKEAGREVREGKDVAIYIGGPRRPSVFFYMPDKVFLKSTSHKPGEEIMLESSDKAPIEGFLARRRPAYILTDSKRAKDLMLGTSDISIDRRADKWVLLRAGEKAKVAKSVVSHLANLNHTQ